MKKLRVFGIIVVAIAIILGIVVYLILPGMLANLFLYPNRQPLVKNPGDYGLMYDDVRIETEDGVTLAGWLMHGTGDDVVIIGHPATFTRYGYSKDHQGMIKSGYDRDVEFIPAAKHLIDAGYTILMYDQRNHGESGASPDGAPHDGGLEAYRDIVAAVQFVSRHPALTGKDIGLLSYCQSAMISMIAMTKESEAFHPAGVKAFAAVQPIAMEVFYRQYGLPGWLIDRIRRVYKVKGAPALESQTPVPYAKNVIVPTLFVQNVNDPWSDMAHSRAIYDAIPTEKEVVWLDEEEHHRFLAYNWFNDHPEKLLAFFSRYLN